MTHWGFPDYFVSWVYSFVTGRTQRVKIDNFTSSVIFVHSGVPQGSHLGPILFNIFINDLTDSVKFSNCLLFADDLKIFRVIRDKQAQELLQEDLLEINRWCISNNLFLNVNKCVSISFCRNKHPLSKVYSINSHNLKQCTDVKELGVIFDCKLTFQKHIYEMCTRASKTWGSKDFNINTLKILYMTWYGLN